MQIAERGGVDTPFAILGLSAWWTSQLFIAPREYLEPSESTGPFSPVPGQLGRDTNLCETKAITSVLRITAKQRTLII